MFTFLCDYYLKKKKKMTDSLLLLVESQEYLCVKQLCII